MGSKRKHINSNRQTQEFVMVLTLDEWMPFRYFLKHYALPVKLESKQVRNMTIECVFKGLPQLDPLIVEQMWDQWKYESMDREYVIKN